MERKKGKQSLAQSTGNTLSFLDKLVADQVADSQPLHEDEFTVYDYMRKMSDASNLIPLNTATNQLNVMVRKGKLRVRKVKINSRYTNVYRPV